MNYKIYTLQHQKLYDQIHCVTGDEKIKKIINKEALYLLDRCRELRRDFSDLSRIRELDALFTDVFVMNKKMTYSFEHIVVVANKVYILERKKTYDNQYQLLKEKVNYLRKMLGKNVKIEFFILIDGKSTKNRNITMEMFAELCRKQNGKDTISGIINNFVQRRHTVIDVKEYLSKKYNADLTKHSVKRNAQWVKIFKLSNPLVSKYKGALSFLSSCIIFFYVATSMFSYSIFAKEKQFLLTIALDVLFLFLLVNVLKEIESKLPRWLKYITLLSALSISAVLFGRVIYYF